MSVKIDGKFYKCINKEQFDKHVKPDIEGSQTYRGLNIFTLRKLGHSKACWVEVPEHVSDWSHHMGADNFCPPKEYTEFKYIWHRSITIAKYIIKSYPESLDKEVVGIE